MAGRKGGGTLDVQRERLKSRLNDDQVARAHRLIEKEPDVVRYAFKCLPKAHLKTGLTKSELRIYEELKKDCSTEVAEKWKATRMKRKSDK